MIQLLEEKRGKLIALCQKYQVRRLDLFGSAAKGRFAPETSDLDFVAEFLERSNPDYANRYYDFAESLQNLFQRRVDLLTENMIRSPYFRQEFETTRQKIYEQ